VKAGIEARRFHVRIAPEKNPIAGQVATCTVVILDGDKEIGKYERNYSAFAAETFEPFEINGKWYALYSSDYEETRVMSLPDCRDLGAEPRQTSRFCPVEFYVPRYRSVTGTRSDGSAREWSYFESAAEKYVHVERDHLGNVQTLGPWQCLHIGFVAGCLWGDDNSWKLEVFDLSHVHEGRLERTARFGHLELANGLTLAEAVRLHRSDGVPLRATIVRQQDWDIGKGALIDPYA
jgi:hypothetical protein